MKKIFKKLLIFAAILLPTLLFTACSAGSVDYYAVHEQYADYWQIEIVLDKEVISQLHYNIDNLTSEITNSFTSNDWTSDGLITDEDTRIEYLVFYKEMPTTVEETEEEEEEDEEDNSPSTYADLDYGFYFYHYDYEMNNPFYDMLNPTDGYLRPVIDQLLTSKSEFAPFINSLPLNYHYVTRTSLLRTNADTRTEVTSSGILGTTLYQSSWSTTYGEAVAGLTPKVVIRRYFVNTDGWYITAILLALAVVVIIRLTTKNKPRPADEFDVSIKPRRNFYPQAPQNFYGNQGFYNQNTNNPYNQPNNQNQNGYYMPPNGQNNPNNNQNQFNQPNYPNQNQNGYYMPPNNQGGQNPQNNYNPNQNGQSYNLTPNGWQQNNQNQPQAQQPQQAPTAPSAKPPEADSDGQKNPNDPFDNN